MEVSQTKKVKTKKQNIIDWVFTILIFLVTFIIFRSFVGQQVITSGESMSPTLVHGDTIFVEKFTYLFSHPKHGDVIVFPYALEPSKHFIKRVIGVPGDVIDIKNGEFYVNGELLNDDFSGVLISEGDNKYPLTVDEKTYFVLGDNRAVSRDSRYQEVGLINEKDINGHAVLVYYPFKNMRIIK